MRNDRLQYLLDRYFDQALATEEKQELEATLLESIEAREMFWRLSHWNGAIRQWGEEELGRLDSVEAVPAVAPPQYLHPLPTAPRASVPRPARGRAVRQPSTTAGWWWPLAAAAVVILGLFAWLQQDKEFARVSHASTAVWADGTTPPKDGKGLRGATLKLKSGAVQIHFSRGARVVLEGPAEFELLSENSGALRHGKLFATVPESAHGFTVQTPGLSIVDHGTQFGCIIADAAEVHVFQGAVGLETPAMASKEIRENQAVRLTGAEFQDIPPNLSAFLTEEKLVRMENARPQLERWRQSSRAFRQHPGLLAYFDFENDSGAGAARTLMNRAPNARPETHGTIEGCAWSEGRWPGKGALQFRSSNDRVRLSLSGEYPAMTFVASLNVAGTPNRENSLLRTTPQAQLGEAHWYLTGEGALGWSARIAPRGAGTQWLHLTSSPVVRDETLASWRMVAAVFDGAKVTHYLDGKAVGGGPAVLPRPVRLDELQLGNGDAVFGPRPPGETAGNFTGTIDELAILAVPLSSTEIRRLYEQGRPGGG